MPTTQSFLPSSTPSLQINTMSQKQSIKDGIETNVLQQNVNFDELPQDDNKILALNWLSDEDQMQFNSMNSNLNQ
jgi:hypothetical protein